MSSKKKETDIKGNPHNPKDMEREWLYTGGGSVPSAYDVEWQG
jgi:hypothetical protein